MKFFFIKKQFYTIGFDLKFEFRFLRTFLDLSLLNKFIYLRNKMS